GTRCPPPPPGASSCGRCSWRRPTTAGRWHSDAIRLAPPAFSGAPALVTWRSGLLPLPRLLPPPPTSVSVAGDRQRNLGIRGRCLTLRSEEHTSELQSRFDFVFRLLLEKKYFFLYILFLYFFYFFYFIFYKIT